jgi:hypothetical protein
MYVFCMNVLYAFCMYAFCMYAWRVAESVGTSPGVYQPDRQTLLFFFYKSLRFKMDLRSRAQIKET